MVLLLAEGCKPFLDDLEPIEEARNNHVRRPPLARQMADRFGHARRIARTRRFRQHPHDADLLRRDRADVLLQTGTGTRHDERRLVERQQFADVL